MPMHLFAAIIFILPIFSLVVDKSNGNFVDTADDGINNNVQQQCGISPYSPPPPESAFSAKSLNRANRFSIISGHTVTNASQFPWIVKIILPPYIPTVPYTVCTGTIVSRRYILTASQCLFVYYQPMGYGLNHWPAVNTSVFDIVAGTVRANDSKAIKIQSSRIIPHPEGGVYRVEYPFGKSGPSFTFAPEQDIALIELSTSLNFTENISPICIPVNDAPFFNRAAVVAGWGKTRPHLYAKEAKKLHAGETFVFDTEQKVCSNYTVFDLQKQLCTGIGGSKTSSRACIGDSGGPIMFEFDHDRTSSPRWYQFGIPSMAIGKGAFCGSPGIGTRVSHYCDWIAAASNGEVKCV